MAVSADANLTALRTTTYGFPTSVMALGAQSYRDRYIGVDPKMNVVASMVLPELQSEHSRWPECSGANRALRACNCNDSGSLIYATTPQEVDVYDVHRMATFEREFSCPPRFPIHRGQEVLTQSAIDETGDAHFLDHANGAWKLFNSTQCHCLSAACVSARWVWRHQMVTLRGSGFESGAQVLFGGVAAAVTFVDADTLQDLYLQLLRWVLCRSRSRILTGKSTHWTTRTPQAELFSSHSSLPRILRIGILVLISAARAASDRF